MPTPHLSHTECCSGRPSASSRLDAIRAHILALKQPLDAEIRAYPPPIPACDAQFNYLLDRRAALSRALVRLDEIARKTLPPAAEARALDAFIETCDDIDTETATALRARFG